MAQSQLVDVSKRFNLFFKKSKKIDSNQDKKLNKKLTFNEKNQKLRKMLTFNETKDDKTGMIENEVKDRF